MTGLYVRGTLVFRGLNEELIQQEFLIKYIEMKFLTLPLTKQKYKKKRSKNIIQLHNS